MSLYVSFVWKGLYIFLLLLLVCFFMHAIVAVVKLTGYMLDRNILRKPGIPKINLQPGCEFKSWGQ